MLIQTIIMKPFKRIFGVILIIITLPILWFELTLRVFIEIGQWIWCGEGTALDNVYIFNFLNLFLD